MERMVARKVARFITESAEVADENGYVRCAICERGSDGIESIHHQRWCIVRQVNQLMLLLRRSDLGD